MGGTVCFEYIRDPLDIMQDSLRVGMVTRYQGVTHQQDRLWSIIFTYHVSPVLEDERLYNRAITH